MNHTTLKLTFIVVACSSVLSFAALPELRINAQNNADVDNSSQPANRPGAGNCATDNTHSHRYTAMSLTLTDAGNPANNISVSSYADSIRGRGNSTWGQPKKPYRIKFGEKRSVFGLQKNKSWALLANYYDPTFALNAVGFELGKRLGLPGTPNHFLVDLYLNNTYRGIYQLTDIVQVNKGRVDINEKDGWLVEFDYHCPSDADEIDFNTDYPSNEKMHTFVKSPEVENNFNINNPLVSFVKTQVNELTAAMFNRGGFPENGYRDLIDLESVVKYVMIQQFIDNFDFNNRAGENAIVKIGPAPGSNFFHKDKGKKIVAGPLWDMDLAAGVLNEGNFPKHYQTFQAPIKPLHPFYLKFFDDPVFLAKWKKVWDRHKNDFQAMTGYMDSIASYVQGSVERNFALQNSGGNGGIPGYPGIPGIPGMGGCFMYCPEAPATVQAYRDEVGKLKTWWGQRINFFEQEINAMNIDISKDIPDADPPSTSVSSGSKPPNGSRVASVRNGLNLGAANSASVKVFGLNGNVIRARQFTGGNHSVGLGDLPKGVYMVRVTVDGHKQVLRVPVR